LVPEEVRRLCGCQHPAIVDGRNVVDPDVWINAGFAYRGIGWNDKNQHALQEYYLLFQSDSLTCEAAWQEIAVIILWRLRWKPVYANRDRL